MTGFIRNGSVKVVHNPCSRFRVQCSMFIEDSNQDAEHVPGLDNPPPINEEMGRRNY